MSESATVYQPEGCEDTQAYWALRNGLTDLYERVENAFPVGMGDPDWSSDFTRLVPPLLASLVQTLNLDEGQRAQVLYVIKTSGTTNRWTLIAILQNLIFHNLGHSGVQTFLADHRGELDELMKLGKEPEAAKAVDAPIDVVLKKVEAVVAASGPESTPEDPRLSMVKVEWEKLSPEIKEFYSWGRVVEAFGRVNPLNGRPYVEAVANVQGLPNGELFLTICNGELYFVDGGATPRSLTDPKELEPLGLSLGSQQDALERDSRANVKESMSNGEVMRRGNRGTLVEFVKKSTYRGEAHLDVTEWSPSDKLSPMRAELRVPLVQTALDGVQRDFVNWFREHFPRNGSAWKLPTHTMGRELLLDALLGTLQPGQVDAMMMEDGKCYEDGGTVRDACATRFVLTCSPKPENEQMVDAPRVYTWAITDTSGEFSPNGEFVDDKDIVKAIVRRHPKQTIEMGADEQTWMWTALNYLTNGRRDLVTPIDEGHQALRKAIVHSLSQEEAACMKKHLAPNPKSNCKLTCEKGPAKDGKQVYRWMIYVREETRSRNDGSTYVIPEMDYHGEFESDT